MIGCHGGLELAVGLQGVGALVCAPTSRLHDPGLGPGR